MPSGWMHMAAMSAARLAPDVITGAMKESCDQPCEGVPARTGGLVGTHETRRHWHHECWSCGTEVITRMPRTYHCRDCDVTAAPGTVSHAHDSFDSALAAALPSPG